MTQHEQIRTSRLPSVKRDENEGRATQASHPTNYIRKISASLECPLCRFRLSLIREMLAIIKGESMLDASSLRRGRSAERMQSIKLRIGWRWDALSFVREAKVRGEHKSKVYVRSFMYLLTGTSIVPVQSGSIGKRLPGLASENCKRLARLVALELRRPECVLPRSPRLLMIKHREVVPA